MDVTLLSYIESSGSQWINTGLNPTNPKIELVASDIVVSDSNTAWICGIYPGSSSSSNFAIGYKNGLIYAIGSTVNTSSSVTFIDNSTLILTTASFTQNGASIVALSNTYSKSDQTIAIFGALRSGNPYEISRLSSMKIYSFKIYEGDTLLANLVPAKRNSDDAIGMYDQLNDTFFENQSSTPFIAGSAIIPAVKSVNKVVLSDNTVLIDLTSDDVTAADVASGKKFHTADGKQVTGTYTSSSTSTIQVYSDRDSVTGTTLTKTGVKLTVATTGTYKVSWMSARSYASGTSGSQLYINSSAYGSEFTSFTETNNNNVCYCTLTGVSLTAGQVIEIYARGSSTTRYTTVGNLIIEKTF